MQAKQKPSNAETIAIEKRDLVRAWRLLENLVVSLHRIGSAHAVPSAEQFTDDRRQRMLAQIGQFVTESLADDANALRLALGNYLSDDEAEVISDSLSYWEPQPEPNAGP